MRALHDDVRYLKALLAEEWTWRTQRLVALGVPVALKTNAGQDLQAAALGGDLTGDTGTGANVSYTATSVTDTGKAWTTNAWAGHVVTQAGVYAVVLSNTATVLTVDRWYTPGSPGGSTASTPSNNSTYQIVGGNSPAYWIALSTNATGPSATDTSLAGELNNASGGLNRAVATYAHTAGVNTYTLTKTYTANANDGSSNTIQKIGVFNSGPSVAGRMLFETAITSPPTLVSGDQLTITETVTM